MNKNSFLAGMGRQARTDVTISLSLALAAAFFIANGIVSYLNIATLHRDSEAVVRTHEVLIAAEELFSTLKDAETGQRGYVLTGKDAYLAPYDAAVSQISEQMTNLERLTDSAPAQSRRVVALEARLRSKMTEMAETIRVRHIQGFEAAQAIVETDAGKADMDAIRSAIADMKKAENQLRQDKIAEMNSAYRSAVASTVVAAVLGLILSGIITYMISRAGAARWREDWLQAGQAGLSAAMLGEQNMEQLGHNVLAYLTGYGGGHAGAFFVKEGGIYRRAATYGLPTGSDVPEDFRANEGLLGEAAVSGKTVVLRDVPDAHLTVGAALGQWRPRQVVITPAQSEGSVDAVVELGFIDPLDEALLALLARVSEYISVAVRSARYRQHLQNLLEETQRQSEELQTQSEELRVNNEELEEQGRVLKESHVRLEQQQAELEQTNNQLEEQAQALEAQKEDLNRANQSVMLKAQELEQASRYKSDFLANMSHELRTPLNSSLILAKLLSDNAEGNLTEEQVKFAKTIQSSGTDLLILINDILDLSKIEAGQMEIRLEPVSLSRLVGDMKRMFDPVAEQRHLTFAAHIGEGLPDSIDTDRQRLEQILKNLLSNAFKFTETGSVTLDIAVASGNRVRFAVVDTGIGIDPEQHKAIFDAFRQADSTISRKFGGTGLGLSISRELSRLLGGSISLDSAPGEGSTFSITLPQVFDASKVAPMLRSQVPEPAPEPADARPAKKTAARKAADSSSASTRRAADDRDRLTADSRSILVVEDDEAFARILYDLAHDLDFLCLIAQTAEDALSTAQQYSPSAIVLDVGLPDHSGLSVLDRLKRDPKTRHIPVHVVSASDYTHAALSLGAVGYMLKPVKREELVDAFKKFESHLAAKVRHVLIVEDDKVQREAVCKLLKAQDVECIAVGTVAECLEKLKVQTFDCMVLDLTLPDASGYTLLETLSQEDAYSFPPVIVYTGHDLSYDDEQRLRRYSKSIIIKGAKSPERLLDEVTLFLHQVVSDLSPEQQKMLRKAKNRDAVLEGRRILVVEDDVRNVYAVTNIFEPLGANIQIARNGREALAVLEKARMNGADAAIDLVLMDVMMPEMDGLTATREIRKRPEWKRLPVIMLTAKAMKDDQEKCLDAGANDYMAKPLDVEKLISLVRVWMPR